MEVPATAMLDGGSGHIRRHLDLLLRGWFDQKAKHRYIEGSLQLTHYRWIL